jgi:membrane protease YdiL (CAAX protease family)
VEAVAPVARSYPGIKQAILLLLLSLAVSLVAQGALLALEGVGVDPGHPGAQACATLATFAIVVAYGIRRSGAPWREVLPLGPVPLALLAPMIVAVIGVGILLSEADNVLQSVLPPPAWLERMFAELAGGQRSLWGSFALLVVAAPMTEEALFRGVILRGFLDRYATRRAIVVSALLFAVFHLNPWQFLGAATAGLLFAWWRAATGSLLPGLVCHALNNAIPILAASVGGLRIPGYAGVPAGAVEFQPWWFDAIGVVLAAGGLWIVWQRLRRLRAVPPTPAQGAGDVPLR